MFFRACDGWTAYSTAASRSLTSAFRDERSLHESSFASEHDRAAFRHHPGASQAGLDLGFQNFADHMTVDIGQAAIDPVVADGQLFVIDAQLM